MPLPFLAPLLLKLPILGKLPWKLIGAVAVVLLVWWQVAAYGERKADAREVEIRTLWEADTTARDKATAEAAADQAKDTGDAITIGVEEEHGLEEKLAAAVADRDDTFRLLQRARSEVRSCSSGRATDSLVAAQASAQERADAVDRAIAGTVTEHRMNADQLDALVSVLERQQVCPIVRMD